LKGLTLSNTIELFRIVDQVHLSTVHVANTAHIHICYTSIKVWAM